LVRVRNCVFISDNLKIFQNYYRMIDFNSMLRYNGTVKCLKGGGSDAEVVAPRAVGRGGPAVSAPIRKLYRGPGDDIAGAHALRAGAGREL